MAESPQVRSLDDERQILASETEPSFNERAAEFRALLARRKHTHSEVLLREGRDER